MDLPVPRYSYEDLRTKANETLAKYHPSLKIPVPIENIIEFSLEMQIIPCLGY